MYVPNFADREAKNHEIGYYVGYGVPKEEMPRLDTVGLDRDVPKSVNGIAVEDCDRDLRDAPHDDKCSHDVTCYDHVSSREKPTVEKQDR